MFRAVETDFNLDRYLVPFLSENPFFAELSRHIRKVPTEDMPTAGVTFDMKLDDIVLYWNPKFFSTLTPLEIKGVLTHEFYHLIFNHVTHRRRTPHTFWNIATDLAINSVIIEASSGKKFDLGKATDEERVLPKFCLVPGYRPISPKTDRKLTKEEEDATNKLAVIIESFTQLQASEHYFNKLMQKFPSQANGCGCPVHSKEHGAKGPSSQPGQDNGDQNGSENGGQNGECTCNGPGGLGSFDSHDGWDNIPEDVREYVEAAVKNVVGKAVKAADQNSNGWGNIPAEIRDDIRRSVSNNIDWRSVLRQFIGTINRGQRTSSIKRINRRYAYIHPGTKRGYTAKLLIAIDQSGSVGNDMLEEFFAELNTLTRKVDITVLPFDCDANVKEAYEWKKGQRIPAKRTRMGGTDFNAPTNVFNDPKNRGRWDGMLIMTDGEAPAPGPSRGKRGWILGRKQKLYFQSNELQIHIDKEKARMTGAWR